MIEPLMSSKINVNTPIVYYIDFKVCALLNFVIAKEIMRLNGQIDRKNACISLNTVLLCRSPASYLDINAYYSPQANGISEYIFDLDIILKGITRFQLVKNLEISIN